MPASCSVASRVLSFQSFPSEKGRQWKRGTGSAGWNAPVPAVVISVVSLLFHGFDFKIRKQQMAG
jgi:hypothetical protein